MYKSIFERIIRHGAEKRLMEVTCGNNKESKYKRSNECSEGYYTINRKKKAKNA